MTLIRIDLRDAAGSPAIGRISFAPTRRIHVNTDDDHIILPHPFTLDLINGEVDVELIPSADWVWSIIERVPKGIRRWVSVPDSETPLDYGDLTDVDPRTLAPTAQPEAAWWVALSNVAPQPAVGSVTVVTGAEARPDAPMVFWVGGTVQPTNMIDGDVWFAGDTAPPIDPEPELIVPVIGTAALSAMTQNTPVSQNLAVTGSAPILWSVTGGTLPAGLVLSSTGIVSGTPTGSGAYSFTATATNAAGTDTQVYSGTITAEDTEPEPEFPLHSVFADTPSLTFTKYNDGGTLRVATGFYTYQTDTVGWKVKGMRIYLPAGASIPGANCFLYTPAPGVAPNLAFPVQTAVKGALTTGWNSVNFPTPVEMTPGTPLWVGYQTTDGSYVHVATTEAAPFIPAADGSHLVVMDDDAEFGGARLMRSYLAANGGATTGASFGPVYGIDIIVEED